jgi:hypothetical protein
MRRKGKRSANDSEVERIKTDGFKIDNRTGET